RALRNRTFMSGLLLMSLGSLLFGVLGVLAPLHLASAGWGAAAIGGVWLTAAALETVQAPLAGRMSDRTGPLRPTRIALVIVVAALFYGVLFTTAFALLADGAEEAGLAQGMAFGLMNVAWAGGAVLGPAAGGAIAGATGDWIPFVLAAAVCGVVFGVLRRQASARSVHAKLELPGA